jgi:hypothetical protein
MTVTITFPEPAERLMSNDRPHWSRRARLTRIWRTRTYWAVMQTLGNTHKACSQPPSFVRVTFPVTVNRRRDSDGPAPTVKAIVDGLVDAGCWPDDTPEWVETLGSRFDKGGMVIVELIPMEVVAA